MTLFFSNHPDARQLLVNFGIFSFSGPERTDVSRPMRWPEGEKLARADYNCFIITWQVSAQSDLNVFAQIG